VIRRIAVWIVLTVLLVPAAWAGKYNKTLSIGDAAPDWKDLPGVDDMTHSLDEFKDKQCLVIAFTCNTCPYAEDYEGRLVELQKKFAADGKAALVAINANKVKGDLLPDMQQRAKAKGFNFPYLHDETQQVAKAYGATYTPEFVVLDSDRKVVYLGAFDDSTDASKVEKHHVEDAVTAVLEAKTPTTAETPAVGCAVRYEKPKRTRRM
jgi:peroxiredoxin